ncbi:19045_t:CDS:1, partial [Gigaspora rosea]
SFSGNNDCQGRACRKVEDVCEVVSESKVIVRELVAEELEQLH